MNHDTALADICESTETVGSEPTSSLRSTLFDTRESSLRESAPIVKTKRIRPEISHPIPQRFRDRFPYGINWVNAGWMGVMNVGAIAAFWHFSWPALAITVFLHWVTACLGVTLGYHRLLTHGSLVVPRPLKYFFSRRTLFIWFLHEAEPYAGSLLIDASNEIRPEILHKAFAGTQRESSD